MARTIGVIRNNGEVDTWPVGGPRLSIPTTLAGSPERFQYASVLASIAKGTRVSASECECGGEHECECRQGQRRVRVLAIDSDA